MKSQELTKEQLKEDIQQAVKGIMLTKQGKLKSRSKRYSANLTPTNKATDYPTPTPPR